VILDTNAISAMAEGDTNLEKILPDITSQFLPVICLGEYRAGVIRSKSRAELERWLDVLEQSRAVLRVERGNSSLLRRHCCRLTRTGTDDPAERRLDCSACTPAQTAVAFARQAFR
jgi:predicted nucleic acid-binding protein